jgi:hypothetical protein
MHIIGVYHCGNLLRGYSTSVTGYRSCLAARQAANTSPFVKIHMGALLTNYFIPGPGVHINRNLVGHGPAGTKNGGFHSKHLRNMRFQFVYRKIFAKDVVSHLCCKHGIEHGLCGLGEGVGAEFYGFCHG